MTMHGCTVEWERGSQPFSSGARPPRDGEVETLHHAAHGRCFIAGSVRGAEPSFSSALPGDADLATSRSAPQAAHPPCSAGCSPGRPRSRGQRACQVRTRV